MSTWDTRRESLLNTDRKTRQRMILAAWDGVMTAREVRDKLNFRDMNSVRPRITELVKMGVLEVYGDKYDPLTDRTVTCWRVSSEQLDLLKCVI